MGKLVLWIVLAVWSFFGLALIIYGYHSVSLRPTFEKHPVAMCLACIVGGPIIPIIGIVKGTIMYIKGKRKERKKDKK